MSTFGEPAILLRRAPRPKRRPLVILCDVSGSMEAYTRLLLHMSHALGREWGRVETFAFGTRLTRITRQLRERRPDAALARVSRTVTDWSGGTRIGDALHEFNLLWSRRVLGRGAVVLLVTDGWERGDHRFLEREAVRLQRASYRLVWLDPLSGTRDYSPDSRVRERSSRTSTITSPPTRWTAFCASRSFWERSGGAGRFAERKHPDIGDESPCRTAYRANATVATS
jgi:hypothetical protein